MSIGLASRILNSTARGPMDDVARTLAQQGRALAGGASPLQRFAAHVDDATRLFDDALTSGSRVGSAGDDAAHVTGLVSRLRAASGVLEEAHRLPVRHQAMGHADTARAAADRVVAALDDAVKGGAAFRQPTMGEPVFMDLWKMRHSLTEAANSVGMAKVLGNWR